MADQKLQKEHGVALVELAILLPAVMIVALNLWNFGQVTLEINNSLSSARHGARAGAMLASGLSTVNCSEIVDASEQATADALQRTPSSRPGAWGNPTATVTNDTWDGLTSTFVRVDLEMNPNKGCVLCIDRYIARMMPKVRAVFPLHRACNAGV